ncbi:uncharacterized protein LOC143275429 isoform X2 [Babylonia areolata]
MEKQTCPTCGREFQRLYQHKCPNAAPGASGSARRRDESAVKSDTKQKQPCPSCDREFERLWQHKCPNAASSPSGYTTSHGKSVTRETQEKQPCPTCGREFVRLWQHKCPNAISSPSSDTTCHEKSVSLDTKQKQPCPFCGREFERLWQHKCPALTSSPSDRETNSGNPTGAASDMMEKRKQPCPTCDREFERLWQHKCPNAASPSSDTSSHGKSESRDSSEKQPCPTCGREFVRLWQHKCPNAISSPSDDTTSHDKSRTRETQEKQPCPTCGREFVRLWQHKCPNAASSPSGDTTSHVMSVSRDTQEKHPCPTCGREFVRLWQHKCPNAVSSPSSDTTCHEKSVSLDTKQKQPCPFCGREFERLWQHKCLALTSSPSDCETNSSNLTGAASDTMEKHKQPCPTCDREFERLWQHKCPNAARPSSDTSSHGKSVSRGSSEKQPCPICGREFVRLWQHKCPNAISSPSDDTASHDMSVTRETQEKQPCPTCGREFVRLWQHKCPSAISSPSDDTASHDMSVTRETQEKQPCPTCGREFVRLWQHKCPNAISSPSSETISAADSESSANFSGNERQMFPGNQPVIDTKILEEKAERVIEALQLQVSFKPYSDVVAFFNDEVKVEKKEKGVVASAFNNFRRRIMEQLKESTDCPQWESLNSGSSYDGTKVTRADETDCMFFPHLPSTWLRVTHEGAPPGFCFVEMTSDVPRDDDAPGHFLRKLCSDGNRVSSRKFRETVFPVFGKAVGDERRAKVDPGGKPGAASFPVLLYAIPRTDGVQGLRPVSIDLVPALRLDGFPEEPGSNLRLLDRQDAEAIRMAGFHVVPKECTNEAYASVRHLLWRFSFSQAEKTLTKFADRMVDNAMDQAQAQDQPDGQSSPPSCRKVVLRILKRLLELFKGLENSRTTKSKMLQFREAVDFLKGHGGYSGLKVEKFSTYQIRTLMWTEFYVTSPGNALWGTNCKRRRLIHCLIQLKKMISGRMRVPHFFVPSLDIMAEVPLPEREFLYILFHIAKELF